MRVPLLSQELTDFDLMLGLTIDCCEVVMLLLRRFQTSVGLRATDLRLQVLELLVLASGEANESLRGHNRLFKSILLVGPLEGLVRRYVIISSVLTFSVFLFFTCVYERARIGSSWSQNCNSGCCVFLLVNRVVALR